MIKLKELVKREVLKAVEAARKRSKELSNK